MKKWDKEGWLPQALEQVAGEIAKKREEKQ